MPSCIRERLSKYETPASASSLETTTAWSSSEFSGAKSDYDEIPLGDPVYDTVSNDTTVQQAN